MGQNRCRLPLPSTLSQPAEKQLLISYPKIMYKVLYYKIKRLTFHKMLCKFKGIFYKKTIYLYCKYEGPEISPLYSNHIINVQKYSDLELYSGSIPWMTKPDLIEMAQIRSARGAILYTITSNGILAHFGWLTMGGKDHYFNEVDITYRSAADSVHLFDFYTDPLFRRQGFYEMNLKKMISDSFESYGAKEIYIGVRHDNAASKSAIEKAGFKICMKFVRIRIGWYVKKALIR